MKTLWNFILLMGILCLAGCSSDEPQSVSFPEERIESPSCGWTYNLNIEANCPWSIRSESPNIRIEPSSGKGSSTSVLHLPENNTYDDITFRITVTSEDGTSSDVLTIVQKAMTGLEVERTGIISEEGGTFTMSVRTNDNITTVGTPDWITFTSSRALTGYTYTFSAEPNKTGAVRKGTVSFNGEGGSYQTEVTQDSYAPDSAWVEVPVCVLRGTSGDYPIHVVPEYADMSKVTVTENCFYLNAGISDNKLHLDFHSLETDYLEEVSFQLNVNGEAVSEYTVGIVRPDIYLTSPRYMYYPGENFYIETIPEPYSKITYSNPDVITKLEDGRLHAAKNGTCTITVTNMASEAVTSKTFTVYDIALDSKYYGVSNPHDDLWELTIHGTARGRGITLYKMYITLEGSTEQLAVKQGSGNDNTYSINYSGTISFNGMDYESAIDIIRHAKFHFEGVVGGKEVSAEIPADTIL